jgi:hypothetical protein
MVFLHPISTYQGRPYRHTKGVQIVEDLWEDVHLYLSPI